MGHSSFWRMLLAVLGMLIALLALINWKFYGRIKYPKWLLVAGVYTGLISFMFCFALASILASHLFG